MPMAFEHIVAQVTGHVLHKPRVLSIDDAIIVVVRVGGVRIIEIGESVLVEVAGAQSWQLGLRVGASGFEVRAIGVDRDINATARIV